MFPWTMTNSTISILIDGEAYSIANDAQGFADARNAIFEENWDLVKSILAPGPKIQDWSEGVFVYESGRLTCADEDIPQQLISRIRTALEEGHKPTALIRFWERLKNNYSKRSVDMLYEFLKHTAIPLDEDGYVLAYKGVREDYYDKHSGTFLNTPGSAFKMARNKISDDPNSACAEGFHVGSLGYAKGFGARVVIVRVDPADVVCVPYDSNQEKMRVCAYSVVGNLGLTLPNVIATSDFYDFDEEEEEFEEEFDEDYEDTDDEDETDDPLDLSHLTLDELRKVAKEKGIKNVKAVPGGKQGLLRRIQGACPSLSQESFSSWPKTDRPFRARTLSR